MWAIKNKKHRGNLEKKVDAFFAQQSKDRHPAVIQPSIRCNCSDFQDKYDRQKKRGLNPDPPEICPSCKRCIENFRFRVHKQKNSNAA